MQGPRLPQAAPRSMAVCLCERRRPTSAPQGEALSPGRCSTRDPGPHRTLAKPSWSSCVSPGRSLAALWVSRKQEGAMNMPQKNLRVLVVGGGLGGLCLAQGLRKAGISVAVYERDRSPEVRTQGYRFHMDIRGEEALRACLPPSLYELALATRAQPSKGATVFRIVDGELRE